jgi:hypothetical protein
MRSRRQPIIRFELDHWPNRNTHRRKRLFERMKLRQQGAFDSRAGLISGQS